jgi:hypothetical protein
MRQALALKKPKKFKPASALFVEYSPFQLKSLPTILQQVFLPHPSPPLSKGRELNSPQVRLLVQIPDFSKDTVGELTDGSDPSPTPLLLGEGLSGSPFPTREGGWGVRFPNSPAVSSKKSGISSRLGTLPDDAFTATRHSCTL